MSVSTRRVLEVEQAPLGAPIAKAQGIAKTLGRASLERIREDGIRVHLVRTFGLRNCPASIRGQRAQINDGFIGNFAAVRAVRVHAIDEI
jgi:hypothetical protein